MTATTTIKVSTALRDRIAADARDRQQPIGQFLTELLDSWEQAQRWAALKASIDAHPPDDDYWREFGEFDQISGEAPVG